MGLEQQDNKVQLEQQAAAAQFQYQPVLVNLDSLEVEVEVEGDMAAGVFFLPLLYQDKPVRRLAVRVPVVPVAQAIFSQAAKQQ